ncbi:hypothetical protein MNQ96_18265 [Sphingopyxis granuli]|uniref:DUF6790 family protein n=1 Tax=Sphingopyxis granuli TaxID=267128 RepID=UPI001F52B792|nr:DUF6790 family protein [Sphingopyxis granuli]UNK79439.1 hypothetical protein MNQ96_18265 [Sphingopyxis granuli]
MHLTVVLLTMLILPAASVLVERWTGSGTINLWWLIGKWFVFWGVGVRLFIAGARQIVKPELTATGIFGVTDRAAFPLAQELGFWNLTIGLISIASIRRPEWVAPMAIAGMLFYAMAGALHVAGKDRGFSENVAMISDLGMAGLLLASLVATFPLWARS